jgi:hypothetical protein
MHRNAAKPTPSLGTQRPPEAADGTLDSLEDSGSREGRVWRGDRIIIPYLTPVPTPPELGGDESLGQLERLAHHRTFNHRLLRHTHAHLREVPKCTLARHALHRPRGSACVGSAMVRPRYKRG